MRLISGENGEKGIVLIAALLAMLLLAALGAALALTTTIETTIAGNYLRVEQARGAAEAALEQALIDLAAAPDWSAVLGGAAASSLVDGAPAGTRRFADGSMVDLDALVNMASCESRRACSRAEIASLTPARPWGANNPVWRLYAYGSLGSMLPGDPSSSAYYVVTLVGDDPSESDGDPLVDGGGVGNPGKDVLAIRAEAFGARGLRVALRATVGRSSAGEARLVSWRILGRRS